MNQKQMNAAMESLSEWLAHPAELGKAPAKIECAGEFDLHDLHYYIFRYKKSRMGKWLLGVCGGYEGDGLEHCGHVFSEMEDYDPADAQEKAIALVEAVRSYWMEQARRAEEQKENPGTFVNYVLLKEANWDKEALLRNLKETWGIEDEPDNGEDEDGEDTDTDEVFVISYQGAMIAVSFMPAPIPDGEAEEAAAKNFMWPDGAEQVKSHMAHLLIAVMGKETSPIECGTFLAKTVTSACKQEGVLGIYTGEVVYAPDYYQRFSGMLEEDLFPIYNLVWIGLYNGKKGLCAYTGGMRYFGYDEVEVLDSQADAQTLHGFLSDIANYVITEDVVLRDGERIGFSEEQKLAITKSKGVAVEGNSLKIEF
nr:DUF4261 domain-containing protein [uncultured Acetatifactor sp.]